MRYLTTEELRDEIDEVCRGIDDGEEYVITRDGEAFALLVRTTSEADEPQLRAHRATSLGVVVARMQAHSSESAADRLTEAEIQAEIDAVREERRRHADAGTD